MQKNTEFQIRTREQQEALEASSLSPYAKLSRDAHGTRHFDEPVHSYRMAFQRDRDRIIHSRAFRRLKHKRQVFLTTESDHYRTRMTHTLEVAQLSGTLARALGLNEDLVEAIALGHDLGHTPFGHLGEVILNEIMSGKKKVQGQKKLIDFGGFKHNYQSVRVVDLLEKKYPCDGLNLTAPVREGILKHTRIKRGKFDFPDFNYDGLNFETDIASTLEGQVVAICDEIAQRTHDLEDGIRAGLVDLNEIRELEIVKIVEAQHDITAQEGALLYQGVIINGLINFLVDDVIGNTLKRIGDFSARKHRLDNFDEEIVAFSARANPLQKQLNKFIYREIIDFSRVKWSDELGEKLIFRLFQAYVQNPDILPEYVLKKCLADEKRTSLTDPDRERMSADPIFFRIVCDYIAGMSDAYAVREAEKLSRLKKIDVSDLNLEVALGLKF